MPTLSRRRFLSSSSIIAGTCASNLSFLAQLGHAAATDTAIQASEVIFGAETDRLLELLRSSSLDDCVPAFVKEIKNGLSYRHFLTVLFLAAVENGDPHQMAQVYGAHRISSDVRIEERLLPLFWVLNRIKRETEAGRAGHPAVRPFKGVLPQSDVAESIFREALLKQDSDTAERAALALARDHGAQYVMRKLWEFAPRNVGGNLGHPAIALANGFRTLDVMGWQHSEVGLRYVTGYIAGYEGDKTCGKNLERVKRTARELPIGWTAATGHQEATRALFKLLHEGKADEASDFICSELRSRKMHVGAVWDAISLSAADSIFRHKIGGGMLGGHIHAVTTTNALRFGFDLVDDPETKLLNLLQAAGVICDFYVRHPNHSADLREIALLDLAAASQARTTAIPEIFEMLPYKAREHFEPKPGERDASDEACRRAFTLLQQERNQTAFMQSARSFLCLKASLDPHDIKFPAAIFEDAANVSARWRPFILAASVHALHGSKSPDTSVLVQVRGAMKT
jgi:hypothetical protein